VAAPKIVGGPTSNGGIRAIIARPVPSTAAQKASDEQDSDVRMLFSSNFTGALHEVPSKVSDEVKSTAAQNSDEGQEIPVSHPLLSRLAGLLHPIPSKVVMSPSIEAPRLTATQNDADEQDTAS